MEQILITGLDGSGKSTILKALSELRKNQTFDVLLLPHMDIESLNNDPELKTTAAFVNMLSLEADMVKIPQLKAIAIFASMLLFKNLVKYKTSPGLRTLYCERHPLVDTGIYAQFYAGKMGEGTIDIHLQKRIDEAYKTEIEYLIRLIPSKLFHRKSKSIASLAEFITQWFFVENKLDSKKLKRLFQVDLPSKIYYLKASPEILIQRIAARTMHEAHETVDILTKLSHAYDVLFTGLLKEYPAMVEIVNANDARSLDDFQKRLTSAHK